MVGSVMETAGRPKSFMANILTLLEVFLILTTVAIVALGFATGLDGWTYLALIVLAIVVIVHLARRNHRRELELHRPAAGLWFPPTAPPVPTVPPVPIYNRGWETRAPLPPTVTFPRQAGNQPPQGIPRPLGVGSMVCRSCGSWVRSGSKFCHRCGRPINPT